MKQILQNLRNGEIIVAEVPVPTPGKGQALVRTAASLVSAGTERMVVEFAEKSLLGKARSRPDLVRQVLDKARREGLLTTLDATINRLEQPLPLGYSSAGAIVLLGEGMEGFRAGERVACAGGGYAVHAEYAIVPRNLLVPIPQAVDFESAAFTTLGAIALHGYRLTEIQLGESVAVIGLGLLGLLAAGIARAAGCQVFGVDLDERRVALAKQLGVQATQRDGAEEAAASFSRGRGFDAILICADTSSADPVELAGSIARDRARVVAVGSVGLHIPRKIYYEKELIFINSRSYGPGRYDPSYEEKGRDYPIGYIRWSEGRNLEAIVDMLSSGRLDVKALVSHRFTIQDAPQAYELITGKQDEPFLGVLLTYPQKEDEESVSREAEPQLVIDEDASRPVKPLPEQPQKASGAQFGKARLGVLGAGNFASAVMLPAISKLHGVELVGIASAAGVSAQHAVKKFGFSYATSEESDIIDDPQINAVAVLTRHNLHAQQVLSALQAGKHVFCEKPLALNLAELSRIERALCSFSDNEKTETISREESATLEPESLPAPILMVGFNRRFAPLTLRLKEFLANSTEPLVAHYRVNAGYIPLDHWTQDPEQGGGRLIGEACHFIDFLTFLVGSPPVGVSAYGLPDRDRYREDNLVLIMNFADGSVGTVSYLANGDKAFSKERVEVFRAGRVGVLDDYRSLETISAGKRRVLRARLRQDKGHQAEGQAFVTAILTAGPPPIPYDQIFGVMRATFAAQDSLRSGKSMDVY